MNTDKNNLPTTWTKTTLSNLGEYFSGVTYKRHEASKEPLEGYLPVLRANNINAHLNIDDLVFVPAEKIKVEQFIKSGDVIICMSSGSKHLVGKAAQATNDINGGFGAFCGLFRSSCMNKKYIGFFFQSPTYRNTVSNVSKGVNINNLRRAHIEDMEIPIAPLPEQQRIVDKIEELFTQLDAGIAELEQAKARLKRYRQAVLKAAVEGELTKEWRKTHKHELEPAEKLLQRILAERRTKWEEEEWQNQIEKAKKKAAQAKRKAVGKPSKISDLSDEEWTNIPGLEYSDFLPKNDRWKEKYTEPDEPEIEGLRQLPEGWIWTSLGQCFEVHIGATPRRNVPEYWGGDISWVSSGEVAFCNIFKTKETITQEGLENTSTDLHPLGTVLLGMIGEGKTRGQAAILKIPSTHNQNSAAIRVAESKLPSEYIYYFLMGEYEKTRRRGSGINQPALNKSRVQAIAFPLPTIPEQLEIVKKIERRLSVVNDVENNIGNELTRAHYLQQSILAEAFEGKLVPQNPEDEPASVLLERIQKEKAM